MEQQTTKYEVRELVESLKTYFGLGLRKNKDGKISYLSQVKNDDGSINKDKTRVFVNLYIAGDKDKNEASNFKDFAVSLAKATVFKEAGIDLGAKLSTPIKIRFTIKETYDSEKKTTSVLRELTNVAHKVDGAWDWVIKPKAQPEEAEVLEVTDDDLPF